MPFVFILTAGMHRVHWVATESWYMEDMMVI